MFECLLSLCLQDLSVQGLITEGMSPGWAEGVEYEMGMGQTRTAEAGCPLHITSVTSGWPQSTGQKL